MLGIQVDVLTTALTAFIGIMVSGMWAYLVQFVNKQKKVNEANKVFMRSMQRAQITHAFQRHVEDGHPITIEEMEHLDACYRAYHEHGGNGTGTLMWERIHEHAKLVTHINEE